MFCCVCVCVCVCVRSSAGCIIYMTSHSQFSIVWGLFHDVVMVTGLKDN